MNEANLECPRFDRCSVNNCPLTQKYPDWPIAPDDSEKKRGLGKKRRTEIGAKYNLRFGGLTPREFSAKKRMESLSPEERQILRDRGKNLSEVRNLSVQPKSGGGS